MIRRRLLRSPAARSLFLPWRVLPDSIFFSLPSPCPAIKSAYLLCSRCIRLIYCRRNSKVSFSPLCASFLSLVLVSFSFFLSFPGRALHRVSAAREGHANFDVMFRTIRPFLVLFSISLMEERPSGIIILPVGQRAQTVDRGTSLSYRKTRKETNIKGGGQK